MRVAREKLIFLALSVLVGWSERSAKGPIQPDIGVRLALAFLFSCGKSHDRRTYDEFWRRLSDPGMKGMHESQRNYMRRCYSDSCIKGIVTDVGAPRTPEYWNALAGAARRKIDDRSARVGGD
jgi:hypothetical protein